MKIQYKVRLIFICKVHIITHYLYQFKIHTLYYYISFLYSRYISLLFETIILVNH